MWRAGALSSGAFVWLFCRVVAEESAEVFSGGEVFVSSSLARLHLWRALAACLCRLAPTVDSSVLLLRRWTCRATCVLQESDIDVVAGRRLSAYAGESLALASDAVAVNAGSTVSMFASRARVYRAAWSLCRRLRVCLWRLATLTLCHLVLSASTRPTRRR